MSLQNLKTRVDKGPNWGTIGRKIKGKKGGGGTRSYLCGVAFSKGTKTQP